jgi:hypothetical protein
MRTTALGKTPALGFTLLVAVLALTPPPTYSITCHYGSVGSGSGFCCETYPDTRIVNIIGYGDVCASRGQGCTECVDIGHGDSCVGNGTYCSPKRPPGLTYA